MFHRRVQPCWPRDYVVMSLALVELQARQHLLPWRCARFCEQSLTLPAQHHHVQRPLVLYADVNHADCQVTEGDRKMLPAANSPDSGRCDTKAFETDQAAAAVLFPGVLCSCHKQLNVQPEQPVDA